MTNINFKTTLQNIRLDRSTEHVHIQFNSPTEMLSSAILNGGHTWANHILNMKVSKNIGNNKMDLLPPDVTIQKYIDQHNWEGKCVGMMTAASMDSFGNHAVTNKDVIVESFVTVGLSNARRAGDPADIKFFEDTNLEPGTINIIFGTNAQLSHAAMVEAIMIASEAKAAVIQEFDIISPVTQKKATGTGTDAIVFFNGSERKINYCGKHVLFGEMIASAVSKAMKDSLEKILK